MSTTNVAANDGGKHDVEIYFETTPEWAVNEISQEVQVTKGETGNIGFVKAGTTEQPILKKKGDNHPHRLGTCLSGCK